MGYSKACRDYLTVHEFNFKPARSDRHDESSQTSRMHSFDRSKDSNASHTQKETNLILGKAYDHILCSTFIIDKV